MISMGKLQLSVCGSPPSDSSRFRLLFRVLRMRLVLGGLAGSAFFSTSSSSETKSTSSSMLASLALSRLTTVTISFSPGTALSATSSTIPSSSCSGCCWLWWGVSWDGRGSSWSMGSSSSLGQSMARGLACIWRQERQAITMMNRNLSCSNISMQQQFLLLQVITPPIAPPLFQQQFNYLLNPNLLLGLDPLRGRSWREGGRKYGNDGSFGGRWGGRRGGGGAGKGCNAFNVLAIISLDYFARDASQ